MGGGGKKPVISQGLKGKIYSQVTFRPFNMKITWWILGEPLPRWRYDTLQLPIENLSLEMLRIEPRFEASMCFTTSPWPFPQEEACRPLKATFLSTFLFLLFFHEALWHAKTELSMQRNQTDSPTTILPPNQWLPCVNFQIDCKLFGPRTFTIFSAKWHVCWWCHAAIIILLLLLILPLM